MIDDKERSREAAGDSGAGSTRGGSEGGEHLPRKERERIMHRDAILDAARDLLTVKPYDQITVQEIAAKSEFSVGYIYKVFDSKESIYVTLIRKLGDDMIAIMDAHLGGGGGFKERLASLVLAIYEWLDANPAFTANHAHEIHCLAHTLPRLGAMHLEREELMQTKIRPFFESGIRDGVVEGDVDLMARTLRALIWGFVGEDLFHGRERSRWAEHAPIVVRAFMRTFAPEGGTK
ncbi:MAG: TetR/AcrR family transcriptional regulator [bacterium]